MLLHPSLRLIEAPTRRSGLPRPVPGSPHARTAPGVLIVSASRGAADDLARAVAVARGGAIGLHRFSLAQLAARLAAPVLAARGIAPVTFIGAEAVAARATFEARATTGSTTSRRSRARPAFRARSRARCTSCCSPRVDAGRARGPAARRTGSRAPARTVRAAVRRGVGDRSRRRCSRPPAEAAGTLRVAAAAAARRARSTRRSSSSFVAKLIAAAPDVLITVPFGDLATLDRIQDARASSRRCSSRQATSDLAALNATCSRPASRRSARPRRRPVLLGARRRTRVRRDRAADPRGSARGVPFDEMAVFVRSPRDYVGLLEHAFARAGIPAWFDRGTGRPHPSGRAFLALLACAVEGCRRAASPSTSRSRRCRTPALGGRPRRRSTACRRSASSGFTGVETPPDEDRRCDCGRPRRRVSASRSTSRTPVVEGTLRAPWKWEKLIVESAVIGGDPSAGTAGSPGSRSSIGSSAIEEAREDPDSPRLAAHRARSRATSAHLRAFALPIIDALAAWPAAATWGEWLDRFEALAPRVLRQPARVLRVLGELRPMARSVRSRSTKRATCSPSGCARSTSTRRRDRYGRVFVGSPHQARGRAFRVVFVPGLAERMFPQKPREDPLLLDTRCASRSTPGCRCRRIARSTERLLLRLAVGAATERLWLSYPRIEVAERAAARAVVLRARRHARDHRAHPEPRGAAATRRSSKGGARLAWPAPAQPARRDRRSSSTTWRCCASCSTRRTARAGPRPRALPAAAERRAAAIGDDAVGARAIALDAAGRPHPRDAGMTKPMLDVAAARRAAVFAVGAAEVRDLPVSVPAVGDLPPRAERGAGAAAEAGSADARRLFHEVQAEFFRALQADGRLPVDAAGVPAALAALDRDARARSPRPTTSGSRRRSSASGATRSPTIGRDLRVWLAPAARTPATGSPTYFEFSFGLSDEGRDPRSVPATRCTIDGRFQLRGSIDLVELRQAAHELRVTDHKTGKNRTTPRRR